MSLVDSIVKSLALRWLKGKVNDLRKQGTVTTLGKVFKFLEGWKLMIGVAILFSAKVYDAMHNGHSGDIIGSLLSVLGWIPGAQSGFTPEGITVAAASGVALVGFIMKLYTAQKQYRAGSSVSGLLSTEGYVASAIQDATKSVEEKK